MATGKITLSMEPIPVVFYARVSTEAQDNDIAVPSQIDKLREYAAANGRYPWKIYTDEGFSGTTDNRLGFREMLLDLNEAGCPVKEILVWDRARFSRNNEHMVAYRGILRRRGTKLVSITQPSDDGPSGELTDGVIDLFNDYFVKINKMQTIRGQRKVAELGYWQTSTTPYGYKRKYEEFGKKQKARLILDPETNPIAREVFEMALGGKTPLEIVRDLNERGIPNANGNPWTRRAILAMLKNPVYAGANVRGRRSKSGQEPTVVPGAFPPTVSQEEFDRIQELISQRKNYEQPPRRSSSTNLLSGLLTCAVHGGRLSATGGGLNKAKYYICSVARERGADACCISRPPASKIEAIVLRKVLDHALTEENIRRVIDLIANDKDNLKDDERRKLKTAERELEKLNIRKKNLLDYMEQGAISFQDAADRMREIQEQVERLEASVAELKAMEAYKLEFTTNAERILKYAKNLATYLRKENVRQAQLFLKSFIVEIIVGEGKGTIRYVVPMPPRNGFPGGDSEELALDEPVLPIGQPATPGSRTLANWSRQNTTSLPRSVPYAQPLRLSWQNCHLAGIYRGTMSTSVR